MIALWVTLGVVAWLAVGAVVSGFVVGYEAVVRGKFDALDCVGLTIAWPVAIVAVVGILVGLIASNWQLFTRRNPLFRFGFWLGQKAGAK